MSNFNITPEQYNEVLLAGLKQIASDAQMLNTGNIAHRAATIRANALQLIDLTKDQNNANGIQPKEQAITDAAGN
jgi:hypothetical protein